MIATLRAMVARSLIQEATLLSALALLALAEGAPEAAQSERGLAGAAPQAQSEAMAAAPVPDWPKLAAVVVAAPSAPDARATRDSRSALRPAPDLLPHQRPVARGPPR